MGYRRNMVRKKHKKNKYRISKKHLRKSRFDFKLAGISLLVWLIISYGVVKVIIWFFSTIQQSSGLKNVVIIITIAILIGILIWYFSQVCNRPPPLSRKEKARIRKDAYDIWKTEDYNKF